MYGGLRRSACTQDTGTEKLSVHTDTQIHKYTDTDTGTDTQTQREAVIDRYTERGVMCTLLLSPSYIYTYTSKAAWLGCL